MTRITPANLVIMVLATLLGFATPKIAVLHPQVLIKDFKDGLIPHLYANFGFIPYGQGMNGKVYYSQSGNKDACSIHHLLTENIEKIHLHDNIIMMVDRGGCTFAQKVRNIQKVGGDMALIVDNSDEDLSKLILSDDGSGAGLHIPAMMISSTDGQKLKNWLYDERISGGVELNVQFMMSDRTTEHSDHVNIDMWYTSSDHKSIRLIEHLGQYVESTTDEFTINPKIVSF